MVVVVVVTTREPFSSRSAQVGEGGKMINDAIKGWITTGEAAELTGYDPAYIRLLAGKGKISAFKFGRDWMVNKAEVLAHKRRMDELGTHKHNPWTGRR